MDDPLCLRALQAVGVDVGHDVMADDLLARLRVLVVDILRMALKLFDLLVGNREAELLLGLREGDPEPAPGLKLRVRRKYRLHLAACVAFRERADIPVKIIAHLYFLFLPWSGFTQTYIVYHTVNAADSQEGIQDTIRLHFNTFFLRGLHFPLVYTRIETAGRCLAGHTPIIIRGLRPWQFSKAPASPS